MRAVSCRNTTAPSSSLLKYLRAQADNCHLFTQNTSLPALHPAFRNRRHGGHPSCQPFPRNLSTTSRRGAVLEASLLSLDFLPKPGTLNVTNLYSAKRPGIIIRHRTQDSQVASRWGSTGFRSLYSRFWKRKRDWDSCRQPDRPLPFLSDSSGTSLGRSKAINDLKLRCTELDENGNVTLVNGEFKKSELIAKYGLLPRDLRKIDSSVLPSIVVRPSALIINLLHLRVLIKHNRVLVFDAYGSTDSYTQSVFMYDLGGKLRQKEGSGGPLPYEFRALEAVLISVTTALESEFETVREPVVRVLRELEEDIDRDKLRHLLVYSKKLGTFLQKAELVLKAIDNLLEEDEDLSGMYLTEHIQGIVREDDDHTEIEMLLESYHKVCDEIVQVSSNLVNSIRNTEEIVKAILDANRNSLMLLDLKFSIGTLGIGSGAFVAALYGMNLENFIEQSEFGFVGITAFSTVITVTVCMYSLQKLRKVQRVSMWGEQGRLNRGNWREVGPGEKGGIRGPMLTNGHSNGLGNGGLAVGRTERLKRIEELKGKPGDDHGLLASMEAKDITVPGK